MTKNVTRKIERLLEREPRGLLISEIAEMSGVHRHTARKYVNLLAGEGKVVKRGVGKATLCYAKSRKLKAAILLLLLTAFAGAFQGGASAVTDCTGTDVAPCHQCDIYGINITLYYPNGTIAVSTLNATPASTGSCTCACYTTDCCATNTYKNYSVAWNIGYTVCPVEGTYNATMNTNATQTATQWEGVSANFSVYTVSWDTDENWCGCKAGAGRWSIGGEVAPTACCGDDSGENKLTRACQGMGCSSDPTDDACCDATTDCVASSACYSSGSSHPTQSGVTCTAGTWTDDYPQWRNQGTNDTDNTIPSGGTINLTAEGYDGVGLGYAWLETNESGDVWINYTGVYGGNYGSPKNMGGSTSWTWSNFTWKNSSVAAVKNVAWKIWYNDTYGQLNSTDVAVFLVEGVPYVGYVNITPASPTAADSLDLYLTCADDDSGASLTAYWRWWKGVVIQPAEGGSAPVSNGTTALADTVDYSKISYAENWTAEIWCGDGFANSTATNVSVIVQERPDHSFQIILNINGTSNSVYVPGTGEMGAGSIGSVTSTSPPHYYIASYANGGDGALYGLAFFYRKFYSIRAYNTQDNHTLVMNTSIENSNVFLVFTKGDWKNINAMANLLEAGTFLMKPLPSFAYGLGKVSRIFVMLAYSSLDLLETGVYGEGASRIYIQKVNETAGKPVMNVTR